MVYDPPPGDQIRLEFTTTYTPPAGDAIHLDLGGAAPPDGGDSVVGLGGIRIPWRQLPAKDRSFQPGFLGKAKAVFREFALGFGHGKASDRATSIPWGMPPRADHHVGIGWGILPALDFTVAAPWINPPAKDHARTIPWRAGDAIDRAAAITWLSPAPKDASKRIPWDAGPPLDRATSLPWFNPPPKDQHHRTAWGREYYERICLRAYEPPPGDAIHLDLSEPIGRVDDGDHIHLRFDSLSYDLRCTQREPSGWRDNYYFERPQPTVGPGKIPWQDVYMIMHQAYVTRVSDGAAVQCRGFEISTDWDSWCWQFTAEIADDASLELIKPTSGGPVAIDVTVDGHVWRMLAESWSIGQTFGKTSRTVRGRSASAVLAAPYAAAYTEIVSMPSTGEQLANLKLEYTGWQAYCDVDWLVPATTYSIQAKTPMDIIADVAASFGGRVETHPTVAQVGIRERYSVKPWLLGTATPALVIPAAYAIQLDGEWDSRPEYNALICQGDQGGISATVTRSGTAGDLPAPMASHPLITDPAVAQALAVAVLGGSGTWIKYTLALPVARDEAGAVGAKGLLDVGDIVEYQVSPTLSWRGFVTAVSVSVAMSDGAIIARQTVAVERPYYFPVT